MDEQRVMTAARYVALNPVRARVVERAEDWRWSSIAARLAGRDDDLVTLAPLVPDCSRPRMKFHRLPSACVGWVAAFLCCFTAASADTDKMDIQGAMESPQEQFALGNFDTLYLSGPIDKDAATRLEEYIVANHVPRESWAVLNSPGGSLYGGMELGRVIRKCDLNTDIGKANTEPAEVMKYDSAGCYSACTLAYLGGRFRFLKSGSHFGVHRFSFAEPLPDESRTAQIASATIIEYLRSMNVDSDVFSLSTTAAPSEIYEPSLAELENLGIVINGFTKPVWSLESRAGTVYLRGMRDTIYGTNKFLLICENGPKLVLHIIFDTKNRDQQLLTFPAHSLVIDGAETPISPAFKKVVNGSFNAEYVLSRKQVSSIRRASTVGVIVQGGYGAPVFLGFDRMPLEDGGDKLQGLMNVCGVKP